MHKDDLNLFRQAKRALKEVQISLLSSLLFIEGVFPESKRSTVLQEELTSHRMREIYARSTIKEIQKRLDVGSICGIPIQVDDEADDTGIVPDQSPDSRYIPPGGGSDAAFDFLAGRECCCQHDCPHHDGMKKNANGEWYTPLYVCSDTITTCRDEDCPHSKGMLKLYGKWSDKK